MEQPTPNKEGEQDQPLPEHNNHKKGGIHNNALFAAGMGRPATAAVDPHNTSSLAQTGTNASYEGPTSLNAGGTAGAGFGLNQSAANSVGRSNSDFLNAGVDNENGKTTDTPENKENDKDDLNAQH